jgi:hypothetical protein
VLAPPLPPLPRPPRRAAWLVVAAASATCGCSRGTATPDRDLGNLVVAPAEPSTTVDVAGIGQDAAALGAALTRPLHRLAEPLGAYRLVVRTRSEVKAGDAVTSSVDEQVVLEVGADGSYRGSSELGSEDGREVVFHGGTLYLRPRFARWHRRPPTDPAEPGRLRDELVAGLAATYQLLGPGLEVSGRAGLSEGGRAAHAFTLAAAPSAHAAPAEATTQRAWRAGRTVDAVAGKIVLDDATGVALVGTIRGQVRFAQAGTPFVMTVSVDHQLTLGPGPAIAPPPAEDTVATPERLREVEDRDQLLRGLAPPTRVDRAPGAAGSTTPGPGQGQAP